MFRSARIHLTLWYVLIIGVITVSISTLFYIQTSRIIEAEYARIERRLQAEQSGMMPMRQPQAGMMPGPRRILPEDLEQARKQVLIQLVLINGTILTVVAVAAYFLAGKTLRPIEQAHLEQERFVADAAHELRTPITALRTSLEVSLMDESLSKSARTVLADNLAEVKTLGLLSEQLLTLANNNSNNTDFQTVDMRDVIADAVKLLSPAAKQKKVKLSYAQPSLPLLIKGNNATLIELGLILIDNAIKYTKAGGKVAVTLIGQKNVVQLTVADTGIGIDKQTQAKVFDRFYRGDAARTRSESSGYGLGLAIAKQIVLQQHGTITVESTVGVGSKFVVTLPKMA